MARGERLHHFLPSLHYHLQQPEMESSMTAHSDVVCHCLLLLQCTRFSVAKVLFWWPDHHWHWAAGGRVYNCTESVKRVFPTQHHLPRRARTPQSPSPNPFVWSFVLVASFVMFLRPSRAPGCRANCKWVRRPVWVPVPTPEQSGVFLGHATCSVKWLKILGTRVETALQARQFHSRQFPNE